ncbi:MAG: HAMP domain-containing sensor histidine kinase [Clostridiaceae bacterium]|nr:HAMP domain-containing sensor histidine kinase [Clostridiaceae bacterium]
MSIRFKLPLLVFIAFLINILLLGGYYNFFLSKEISQYNSSMHEQLQIETDRISKEIDNSQDFSQTLQNISQTKNLILQVIDESGLTVFHAGNDEGVNVEIKASSLFHHDDEIYLLKVTQPSSLKNISSYHLVWNLFIAEIFIICFILLLIAAIIYFYYVKPIVALQKTMENYKYGIHPQYIARIDEIGLLQNRFVKLTEAIEKEKQKQNLIIASISHDIKTPLTSVMGYAERLKKNVLPADKYGKYIDIIYNKSASINSLIEEFDEYLNLQMQSELKQQRISAGKFCAILKSDYEEELTERGVAFSISVKCPDEVLFTDTSKLRRVFGNIIGNSLKHFSLKEPSIAIFCSKQGDAVLFSVEDNGTGVQEEDLQKIFDPFYTSDRSRSVAGLGLSICKEIVEACGGKIWAENNGSGGLSIKISLPYV